MFIRCFNVAPLLTLKNSNNQWLGNSESFSQFLESIYARLVKRMDFPYVVFFEFCLRIVLTVELVLKPVFLAGIEHILRPSSEPKMAGVNARRIIASVAYIQAIGNRTFKKHPSDSMRPHIFWKSSGGYPISKDPVSGPVSARRPFPAVWCFFNVAHKALFLIDTRLYQPIIFQIATTASFRCAQNFFSAFTGHNAPILQIHGGHPHSSARVI